MIIRSMTIDDYDQVYALWSGIKGFGIRAVDDSQEGINRFLLRNPGLSVVAEDNNEITGSILCGHDGRRGTLYHVCVAEKYRKHGVGREMVSEVVSRLKKEGINKVNLIAFRNNLLGNNFWRKEKFTFRDDLNYYDLAISEENKTDFVS
ncbi:MAG: GNAT family N-acetyltransferase [Paenibacillaceae bacterium]|nr:GNAT family N-acetyltransferase [Paenibacillaceae bacterium]